jgi:exopolysaccharide biosynthesis polyprenyl glycosylphosphotransferase
VAGRVSEAPTAEPALIDDVQAQPGSDGAQSERSNSRPARRAALADVLAFGGTDETPLSAPVPNRRDALFRRLVAAADLLAAAGGLGTLSLYSGHPLALVSVVTIPAIVVLAKFMGRYDHDDVVLRKSTLEEIPALATLAAAYGLTWSFVALVSGLRGGAGGGEAIVLWAATSALLIALRLLARAAAQRSAPPERLLIVGGAAARTSVASCIAADPGAHVEIVGFLPLEDERRGISREWRGQSRRRRSLGFADLPRIVRELHIDRVLLIPTSADSELMLDAVRHTTSLGIKVSIVPRLFEVIGSAVDFDSVGGVTVLGVRRAGLGRSSFAVKRLMDVAGALAGIVLLAPLGALVALAIRLDSPGPVFFRQPRVGRSGRAFSMIKFRSMVDGADAQRAALLGRNETAGLFKLSADPRVTRVGRWLRRTSLDELPQLINVLRGEMSLVGPRPLVLDEDRLVEGRDRERLLLAPGMTGPWQVLGPERPPLPEMVKTDYLYAANWSLWTDLKIILRTVGHMLGRRGM